MRGFLLIVTFILIAPCSFAQQFSAKEFLLAASFNEKRLEKFISKDFSPAGNNYKNDTIINIYRIKIDKKKKIQDSVIRRIETYQAKNYFSIAFVTSSTKEFEDNKKALYKEGFFCGQDNDSLKSILFQRKNYSVLVNRQEEEDTLYSFQFHQEELPDISKIQYAEDLMQFTSHEYLLSVFGEKNVIKDVYYLSDKDVTKCSVLFPRTNRQAVFFWQDDQNMCKPSTIIIGGNMNTGSLKNYDGLINENVWMSKDGIYSGMSLYSLVRLNKATFNFYGKNSSSPYLVIPENTGTLDFKNNAVILGCLNPNGSNELENKIVETDKILQDNLGLYVFMMILYPQADESKRRDYFTRK